MPLDQSLPVDHLYQVCDLADCDFITTADLDLLDQPLGQEPAFEAIEFGVDINYSAPVHNCANLARNNRQIGTC